MVHGSETPSTGLLVREYMLEQGEASPYDVYKYLKSYYERHGWKPPSYQSVRTLFSRLKKLNLIRLKRKRETKKGFNKRFYEVVDPDSPDWENPQKALYGSYRGEE